VPTVKEKRKKGSSKKEETKSRPIGIFSANSRGFGFVNTGVPGESDVFIPAPEVNGALHNDTVEYIRTSRKSARPEGSITRVLKRGFDQMAGVFRAVKKAGHIMSMEPKIYYDFPIGAKTVKKLGLMDGQLVMFRVDLEATVHITEILGQKNDPGMDVLALVKQFAVPYVFSDEAIKEAERLPNKVDKTEIENREDFRKWPIATIDGADTKDIDDAISLQILPNGNFELGVHIADVSHYVPFCSALDKEAEKRGTSIYLADRVIPMLPKQLSNGICSLNPKVDRLALSCIMAIDSSGDVVSHRVVRSVIHSKRQFTYDEVSAYLENGDKTGMKGWMRHLSNMNRLAEILHKKRVARGTLEFDFPETVIKVDDNGMPISIEARKRNTAMLLIEEFMLICNETVAEAFPSASSRLVYRTHDSPDADKIHNLATYANNLGYHLPVTEKGASGKALQKLLNDIKGTADDAALGPLILRSMKQARYSLEDTGHFGLAARHYCHFTSPIRRYPDLLCHRAVKVAISDTRRRKLPQEVVTHCSESERTAESLEREVVQLKKVQFMKDKVGQIFEGIVSSVVPWGFYVQLPNTVEGLVSMDSLYPDEYEYIDRQKALFDEFTKKWIKMGNPVQVVLSAVDEMERKINFRLKQISSPAT